MQLPDKPETYQEQLVKFKVKVDQSGRKDDSGKDRWDLLPLRAVREVVRVLTYGAAKYAPNNWQNVADPMDRYYAACQRHLFAWREGEFRDAESGLPHLAHAACCLLFILWLTLGWEKRMEE